MTRLLCFFFTIILSTPATAVFKCTQNGKITYSDQRCPDAQGSIVPLQQTVTAEDAARARQRAQQEKIALEKFEQETRRAALQEQKLQQQHARVVAKQKRVCTTLARQKKWRDEDALHAAPKSAGKLQRQAQRAAEKYAAQCP
jgi:hypothetical protein